MPQLEVSTYISQIFWLIVCFSVLYYLLSRKALPRVAEVLEARADRIRADLDEAQRLKKEAEDALARYERVVARPRAGRRREIAETQAKLRAGLGGRPGQAGREARPGRSPRPRRASPRRARMR
ncbi:MAG: hypothetical protein R3F54_09850 [Alphaproteobacteria bacterium]